MTSTNNSVLVATTTLPDFASAQTIAQVLVEANLAACAQILPAVQSVYRWQGQVETTNEVMLVIKTSGAAFPALRETLVELHPYELPELLAVGVNAGLPAYMRWVLDNTQINNNA